MWGQATITRPVYAQTWEEGLRSFQLRALLTSVAWKRKVGAGQDTAFGPARAGSRSCCGLSGTILPALPHQEPALSHILSLNSLAGRRSLGAAV